ncbi:Protein of unknown function [Pilibacter termitis]|uniref:Uncharacterized protein n=1 Tax=Pilibacter termitis TaxID=263852 RepID=A0A1T4MNQ3_9ENTE|nr:DUF4435 domain-containing protein [Pilibacter termitis]SJZ68424.1 Protein of unknown function [Pilibacter termitis]
METEEFQAIIYGLLEEISFCKKMEFKENEVQRECRDIDEFKKFKQELSEFEEELAKFINDRIYEQSNDRLKKMIVKLFKTSSLNTSGRRIQRLRGRISYLNPALSKIHRLFKLNTKSNICLIGSNGSGKSSFAQYFKDSLEENIVAIPAQKLLFERASRENLIVNKEQVQRILVSSNSLKEKGVSGIMDKFSMFIAGMITEAYNNAVGKEVTDENIFKKFTAIYKELLSIDFVDIFADGQININARVLQPIINEKEILVDNLSDGEKACISFIIQVLMAPADAMIIVDEPETFLNPAVYNRLWNKLEEERKDCQFIYISHNLAFIESRNAEIYHIKEFTYPDKWEFEKISDEIPKHLAIELAGVKQNVLFCEGNDKSSFDYKIYQALFPELSVIPVGSCNEVKRYTIHHNKTSQRNTAFGLIDNDLRIDEEKEKLKENNIFTTKFLEIEMLLCDEEVIRATFDGEAIDDMDERIKEFKEKFVEKITEKQEQIIRNKDKKNYEQVLQTQMYDTKKGKEENIEVLVNKLKDITDSSEEIKAIIETKVYQSLIEICNLGHKEITGELGNKIIDSDFENKTMSKIINNGELQKKIREKYFKGYFETEKLLVPQFLNSFP